MSIELTLNLKQAQQLVDAFGGDQESTLTIAKGVHGGFSGDGLFVYCTDYPEEGVLTTLEE